MSATHQASARRRPLKFGFIGFIALLAALGLAGCAATLDAEGAVPAPAVDFSGEKVAPEPAPNEPVAAPAETSAAGAEGREAKSTSSGAPAAPTEIIENPVRETPEESVSPPPLPPNMPRVPYETLPLPKPRASEGELQTESYSKDPERVPLALSFDNSDVVEVLNVFSSLLNFNYVIEEPLTGTVTLKADLKLTRDQLWDLLRYLLEINGLGLTKKGDLYVVGSTKIQKRHAEWHDRSGRRLVRAGEGMIVQVVPVRHISATEMSNLLTNFASKTTQIQVLDRANLLILIDTPESIAALMQLVDRFDAPDLKGIQARLYDVREVPIERLVKEMEPILANLGVGSLSQSPGGVLLMPIVRLGKLIVLTGEPHNFDLVEFWIEKLDRSEPGEGVSTYIYRVKNGKAEDIAEIIGKLYGTESGAQSSKPAEKKDVIQGTSTGKNAPGTPEPPVRSGGFQELPGAAGKTAKPEGFAATLSNDFRIINDIYSNSLIIQSTYQDYKTLRAVLEEIDVLPKQVLVEVIIADITLRDSTSFGLSWSLNKALNAQSVTTAAAASGGSTTATASSGASLVSGRPIFSMDKGGFLSYMDAGFDFTAFLSAAANKGDVTILSSPTVWATDNIAATINIGQQIPVSTTVVQTDTNLTGTTTFNQSFQYQRVGLILNLTPRITDSGVITLELLLTISESSPGASSTLPIILERSSSTTLWTRDGQAVITGGLIEERTSHTTDGVPFLMDIPILGYLFGNHGANKSRTELVLMIRPHVVRDLEEADRLIKEVTENLDFLKEQLARKQSFGIQELGESPPKQ